MFKEPAIWWLKGKTEKYDAALFFAGRGSLTWALRKQEREKSKHQRRTKEEGRRKIIQKDVRNKENSGSVQQASLPLISRSLWIEPGGLWSTCWWGSCEKELGPQTEGRSPEEARSDNHSCLYIFLETKMQILFICIWTLTKIKRIILNKNIPAFRKIVVVKVCFF